MNLIEFADLLIRHGVVNAINLDGGGSNTLLKDGVLMNYPSDHWLVAPFLFIHSSEYVHVCMHEVPGKCTGLKGNIT